MCSASEDQRTTSKLRNKPNYTTHTLTIEFIDQSEIKAQLDYDKIDAALH